MKVLPIVLFIFQAVSSNACCTEGSTVIQIKNYEGPIYLHAPQIPCDDKLLHHLTPKIGCDFDCNCVSKPTSTCVPINTASQCTTTYNVQYPYKDASVNPAQCTPGLYSYNVPAYPSYQDNQCYPVIQVTTQSGRQDVCGKCGRTYSY